MSHPPLPVVCENSTERCVPPQAVVREGEPPTNTDHPVHLGAEAFVLAELKVTPIVEKKVPGR